jgi:hypothetical protein
MRCDVSAAMRHPVVGPLPRRGDTRRVMAAAGFARMRLADRTSRRNVFDVRLRAA